MIINVISPKDQSNASSQRSRNAEPLLTDNKKITRTFGNEYRRSRNLSRYNNAIKNLIPIRKLQTSENEMPLDNAGFFSTIFFSWITKYLWISYRKGIDITDLPKPSPYDTADYNAKRLEALWNEEVMRHSLAGASFSRAAWKFIRTRVLMSALIFGSSLILGFLGPAIVMRKLLEYVESPDGSFSTGIMWLVLLMISDFTRVALFNWGWSVCYRTGLRMKSAYLTVMYRKLIKSKNITNRNSGKFINMMANDGQNTFDLCLYTPQMIAGPIITILIISYTLFVLSPIALVGFSFFFCFYPLQYLICRLTGYFKRKSISLSDQRVSAVNEVVNCIKLIKMYAWEDPFRFNILDLRKLEKSWLEKMSITRSYGSSLTTTIPIISAIITFLAHVAGGYNLVAAQGFPIMTIYINQMKSCLSSIREGPRYIVEAGISFERLKVFPFVLLLNSQTRHIISFFEVAITTSINAKLSFGRMKDVMCMREVNCYIQKPIVKNQAVTIINGSFACDVDSSDSNDENSGKKTKKMKHLDSKANKLVSLTPKRVEVLSDIMFEAPKSKLIGICGHVGSGKSSLLKATLGHLRMTSGKMSRDGSCAYISQQAWILNTTFKENVLFGNKFDSQRYYSAIALCCLQEDLDSLPAADDTEIGERGINLSGGQKQRVALARAFYADKDIYLLDDPLSAVDVNVGWNIFENLILGALKNKTVIFVSHQIFYLSHCDQIYMMDNGRIIEHGDHVSLIQAGKQYATMVKNTMTNGGSSNSDNRFEMFPNDIENPEYLNIIEEKLEDTMKTMDDKGENEDGALISPENMEKGEIKSATYLMYMNAMGGYAVVTLVLMNVLLNSGCIQFSSWWLATWIKAGSGGMNITIGNETFVSENIIDNPDLGYYQTVYGACIIAIIGSSLLRGFVLTRTALSASTNLHNKVLEKIIYTSMQFFETTTHGRIQNIFSRDISELDGQLPLALEQVLNNIVHGILHVLIICIILPYLTVPFVVLCVIFYFVTKLFRRALRDLQRYESVTRSPIFSLATTTLQGLDTIHAFEKESEFIEQFSNCVDINGTCHFLSNVLSRWAAIRFDSLTIVAYLFTGLAIVFLKGHISPAMAGLALSFCGQMTGLLQFAIRQFSYTELKFISVERIGYYLKSLKDEDLNTEAALVELEYTWPQSGKIEFKNVVLKYRHNTPIVLKNISFHVQAGEKIGIAGRTGSGKSSLISALFRLVEVHEGCIKIDDIDISTVYMQQLRSKLSIIPQDPMIFTGTIRFNLDPWNMQTDEELWFILDKVNLKTKIRSMPGQLNAIVDSGDSNLSMGERQLLCLGRALLRKSKIIILDEATAAVDPETEHIVQMAIQKEFSHCTIITIAHRIQTILSCDRILVMDAGRIIEFDTPHNLLENPSSEFSKMWNAAETTANAHNCEYLSHKHE